MRTSFVWLVSSLIVLDAVVAVDARELPFLGVSTVDVPEVLASHLDIEGGALVEDVLPGSPADAAGLKRHDVVVAAASEDVDDADSLTRIILRHKSGDTVLLRVRRGQKTVELEAKLGSRETQEAEVEKRRGFLGVRYRPVPPVLAVHIGLEKGVGVVLDDVLEDSAAALAGIEETDVLVAVGGDEITEPGDLHRLMGRYEEGEDVKLKLIHRGKEKEVTVTLGAVPDDFEPTVLEWDVEDPFKIPHLDFRPVPHFRGKIIVKGPDGREHVIEIPEIRGKLRGFQRELEKGFEEYFDKVPGDVHKRIQKLLDELDAKDWRDRSLDIEKIFPKGGFRLKGSEKLVMVTRLIEDGYDVTLRQEDGQRTVTVKKDGETLAEDLPLDKLDSLPDDAREKVRKLEESATVELKIESRKEKGKTQRDNTKRISTEEIRV